MAATAQSFARILAGKLLQALLAAFLLLSLFYFLRYITDVAEIRHAELKADLAHIVATMEAGGDPASLPAYRDHPAAYAFRVLERGTPGPRRLIAEVNTGILPPPSRVPGSDRVVNIDLESAFDRRSDPDGGVIWTLTERAHVRQQSIWIEVAMRGDPAYHWVGVMWDEMLDHVFIPSAVIFPTLALLQFLALRRALKPLPGLAAQAQEIGAGIAAGRALTPLPEEGLPLEFGRVVSALNTTLATLEDSFARQRDFAADAAHQLRTPLAVLTLEVARLPDSAARTRIAEEIDRLTRLVNQLLRLAQASDAMARERSAVDLVDVARKVALDLARTALTRDQVIEFDAPETPVTILGNAAMIEEAIANLIDNALRYSPRGQTITVTVTKQPAIIVDDSGPGVADAHKRLIFQRLFRADPRHEDGTGIGLALVRRIAQLHEGEITVQDRPGGGARFMLSLRKP